MYFAGVDVGSATTKAIVVDEGGGTTGHSLFPSGANLAAAAQKALNTAIDGAGISRDQISAVISTGYGRENVEGITKTVTEITCHARGVSTANSAARLVIDIGGQDSKAIALGAGGSVQNFAMNDKCAAGTGRFIEVMAGVLGVELSQIGKVALTADAPARISSTCTVFAESEVVSLLAQGESLPRILAGICNSIAERVKSMATRVGIHPEVVMTGGVALNIGVVKSMERVIGLAVSVPDEPQMTGALGAALIARELRADAKR